MGKLIRDGNQVYEIDEECIRQKEEQAHQKQNGRKNSQRSAPGRPSAPGMPSASGRSSALGRPSAPGRPPELGRPSAPGRPQNTSRIMNQKNK